jgi:hypothetical protein
LLGGQARATALFHFIGQLPHRLLSNNATFSAFEGSLGRVHGGENFRSGALALFPQGKSFPYSVFLAMEAPTLNRLTYKRFLIGGKLYFHTI